MVQEYLLVYSIISKRQEQSKMIDHSNEKGLCAITSLVRCKKSIIRKQDEHHIEYPSNSHQTYEDYVTGTILASSLMV